MARLLVAAALATALLVPSSATAHGSRSGATHRSASTAASGAQRRVRELSTNPVALSLKLAEQYWHGVPACGTPAILTSPHQLPNPDYEPVTSPEPKNSVVEMWTEVQKCTITINSSLWGSWLEDDESFQWFCDAMTHEVGHLFGNPDGGQTDPSLITYPFISGTSPNFNSVPQCRNVTLQYGSEEIRNEEVTGTRGRQHR
jgi:hypothetical protein